MKELRLIVIGLAILVGGLWMFDFLEHPSTEAGLYVAAMCFIAVGNYLFYKRELET